LKEIMLPDHVDLMYSELELAELSSSVDYNWKR
jgi:hypothetical protein